MTFYSFSVIIKYIKRKGRQMDFAAVMERVSLIIESNLGRKPFDKDIAEALEIAPAQYSNNKKKQNIPSLKIIEYCVKHRININWVFSKQGSKSLDNNNENISKIRIINGVNASAGGGAFNEDHEDIDYLSIDNKYLHKIDTRNSKHIEAITISGDSMEPVLNDDSIVLIDREKIKIGNGGIFVVNTTSGLMAKRVSIGQNGTIDLMSDNKLYDTVSVPIDDTYIVGKVIGALEKM